MNQRDIFLRDAADDWYKRNLSKLHLVKEPVGEALERTQLRPVKVLEIGCCNGTVLDALRRRFGSECHGLDPSVSAISDGSQKFPGLHLREGTAESLPYADRTFDLVLFGHSLYLCDPSDYFSIAREADRVLIDGGFIAIKDFISNYAYRNPYVHRSGIFSRKMQFSNLFQWHPAYRLLSRQYFEHGDVNTFARDEAISVDILHKDLAGSFPLLASE